MQSKRILTTKELCISGLFVALLAVGAFITIPTPFVPMTLQVLFVLLCGTILPKELSFFSTVAYLLLGLMGLPIFSNYTGGPSAVFMPTFGYLIGFIFGSVAVSTMLEKRNKTFLNIFITCIIGVLIIYIFGASYFFFIMNTYLGNNVTVSYVLINCFLITLPYDILKSLICAFIGNKLNAINI